jgi:drug/metabolite transporter (DMT)-like permease
MSKTGTGYLYAFGAALALSASFIFSKSALNNISMLQFGAIWFSLGVIWNAAWYFGKGHHKQFKNNLRQRLGVALFIAILEGLATGLFYLAINAMENPAVVSFIGNIGPVFVTIMGIAFLRERFGKLQLAGIFITIAGVFVINFKDGAFGGFMDPGAVFVISASFLFALATISGRKYSEALDPELMSFLRSGLMAIAFIIMLNFNAEGIDFNAPVWRDLALGSLFETLLTIVFAYQALKRIEATATSLIISSKGVWTLILAWVFLDVFPGGMQLLGGGLTMLGIYLITYFKRPS